MSVRIADAILAADSVESGIIGASGQTWCRATRTLHQRLDFDMKFIVRVGIAGAFLLAGTGCGSLMPVAGNPARPVPADVAYRCSVDPAVQMTPLSARGVGEPYLSIPTPQGWEVTHSRDSSLIRGAIVNMDLRANDFTPTALVTLADVSEDSRNPAQAIYTEQEGIEAQPKVSDTSAKDGTLCGYPSRTLKFRYDGRDATTVIVAGTDSSNKTWVCTLGIQTMDPDNPQFVRDRAVILEKFQFLVLEDGAGTE